MSCSACVARVEKAVKNLGGVSDVTVSLLTSEMNVVFTAPCDENSIISAVENAGYKARAIKAGATVVKDGESKKMLIKLIISIVLLLVLMYFSMGHMIGLPLPAFLNDHKGHLIVAFIQAALSVAIMIIHGRFFISGFKAAVHLSPNMDTLVALGSGASFIYSLVVAIIMLTEYLYSGAPTMRDLYFEGAAMIVTLVTVGKTLESYSKKRTTNAYESLMSLAPKTATLIVGGKETVVPVDDVKVGDTFVVKAGEQIPVDGEVLSGSCSVNEAYLTGESIPVDKTVGSLISASTVNMNGHVTAKATKVGEDTTFSQILELVKNVNLTKAPIQRLADKVAGVFVPAVICIAIIVFAVWMLVGAGVSTSLTHAVAVLVISCPCALGLATPVAIMVGSGVGAKHGVLYKNAASLEVAGKINAVVLDKTGTLTIGMPKVTDVIPAGDEKTLIKVALSLEKLSEHPLSVAITNALDGDALPVENYQTISGYGVKGYIDGKLALAGNEKLIKSHGMTVNAVDAARLAEQGKTPLYFAYNGKLLGVIAVADKEKSNAAAVIAALKNRGVKVFMLTGDNRRTALAVAKRLDIDEQNVFSDVLPADKRNIIKELKTRYTVAMVGDGVNDAVALTEAHLGMAIADGSFVAIDSADVVLMNDLTALAFSIKLSKKTLLNIKENLFWAFIYNVVCIPIAAGALSGLGITLSPMIAAAAMSLSSLFVVSNALRLNFVKPDAEVKPVEKACPRDEKNGESCPIVPLSQQNDNNQANGNNNYNNYAESGRQHLLLPLSRSDHKFNGKAFEHQTICVNNGESCAITPLSQQNDKNQTNENNSKEIFYMEKTYDVSGMMCHHCEMHVEKAVSAIDGVTACKADHTTGKVTVTASKQIADEAVKAAIESAGYEVK